MKNFYFLRNVIFLYLFLYLFSLGQLYSQQLQWQQSIGGKQGDYLYDIVSTPDYGFLLAGSSLSGFSDSKQQNPSLNYFL